MDNLAQVVKIAAILAALIALRFFVQAVARRPGSGRFLQGILPFALPPLITGCPMFIAIPAAAYAISDPTVTPYLAVMAFAGGVGLAFGLVALYGLVMRQQRELARLEEMITGASDEGA